MRGFDWRRSRADDPPGTNQWFNLNITGEATGKATCFVGCSRAAATGYHCGLDRPQQVYLCARLNTGPSTFERAPIGFA